MGLLRVASAMSLCAVAFSIQAEQLPIEVLSAVVKDQKIADAEVLLQRNGAQNVVGRTNAQVPEYDTYVAHREVTHPGEPMMTYEEFFRERQEARYGGAGKRGGCC